MAERGKAWSLLAVVCLSVQIGSALFLQDEPETRSKIAFVSDRDGKEEIYVVNPDGSGLKNLTDNPGSDFCPAWSPDGSKIAFRSSRAGGFDLWVMNADGSNQIRVADNEGDNPEFDFTPSWSPDSKRIVFHSRGLGYQRRDVFVVDADGSNLTNLTNNDALGTRVHPAWSPDGQRILMEARIEGRGRGIYTMEPDGTGLLALVKGIRPAWSPDGAKIAFISMEGSPFDISVVNADGSELRSLTAGAVGAIRPSWSPDGSKIAFRSLTEEDCCSLHVIGADGSNLRKVADHLLFDMYGWEPPSWSPDSQWIAFSRSDRPLFAEGARPKKMNEDINSDIYTVDVAGTRLTRLTRHAAHDFDPVWSPPLMK